jgi:hypothetical protein
MSDELKDAAPIETQQFPKSKDVKGSSQPDDQPNPPAIPLTKDCKSNHTKPGPHENKLTKWEIFERWIRVIEFAALISAVPTAIFIGCQWHEMVKASKIAENQLGIMQGQLDEMKQSRILNARAWISFHQIHFTFNKWGEITSNATWKIDYRNSGQTPAINVQVMTWSGGHFEEIPVHDTQPNISNPYKAMMEPGGEGNTPDAILSHGIIEYIKSGMPYYFWGTIWYDDIFGNHHWTQFCYKISSDFEVAPIGSHNSCDDGNTNKTN